jgi:hypothetical protein
MKDKGTLETSWEIFLKMSILLLYFVELPSERTLMV